MKLIYLELNNIGLYKNKRLDFKTENEKDVIFIWGNNGAGKTTFINSIKAGLLGDKAFSFDFNDYCKFIANKLISSRASSETVEASIRVGIEVKENNQNKEYTIERVWIINDSSFDEKLNVYDHTGKLDYEKKEELLNLINDSFPPSLLDVIVFDGENVIQLLSDNKMNALIKEIVYSIFGMDVYAKLSKDLGIYLRSAKSDETITSQEQIELIRLENEYRSYLSRFNKTKAMLDNEETKKNALLRRTKSIANQFSEKTGITIDDIDGIYENITDIESRKKRKDSEIKYINEEILPLKMLQNKLDILKLQIDKERSFLVLKSLDALKEYFSNSIEALDIIRNLEERIPDHDFEFKYNIDDEDYKRFLQVIDLIHRYTKNDLLNNIEEKNIFVDALRNKLATANKVEDQESKSMLGELESLLEETEENQNTIISLYGELNNNSELLTDAKKEYEEYKQMILARKKTSNSYTTVMEYKDAVDEFVRDNTQHICDELDIRVQNELKRIHFRNNSIDRIEISPKTFEMKVFEKSGKLIPSDLLSAGEKQVLLGLIIKESLSVSHTDTFFLFDTPVGRLDSKNRKLFTNKVIFEVSDQVFVFATDSDYSEKDYALIKERITKESVLQRDNNDEIIMRLGSIY